jgi:cytochrome c
MRTKFFILTSFICLVAIWGSLAGCKKGGNTSASERGHDPWVFRSVLDGKARMVTFALHKDLWAAYDAEHGSIFKVWKEGVDFDGPVYTTNHGPQPTTIGASYFINDNREPWHILKGGQDLKPKVQYKGHRFEEGHATMRYELKLDDGTNITVKETPENATKDGKVGFERTYETSNVPNGVQVALDTQLNSLASAKSYETDGTFKVAEPSEKLTNTANGVLTLKSNGKTKFTAWFTNDPLVYGSAAADTTHAEANNPVAGLIQKTDCATCHNTNVKTVGPAYRAIADKYKNTSSTVNMLVGKVTNGGSGVWGATAMTPHPNVPADDVKKIVEWIMTLDGEPAHEDPMDQGGIHYPITVDKKNDAHKGLVANAYQYDALPTEGFPTITVEDSPVYSGVVEAIHANDIADFGDLKENFYIEFTGFLNIPEDNNYEFRLVSDDGSQLFLDDKKVVDNSGFHGADPKEAEIQLKKGTHALRLPYFQGGGGMAVSLQWMKHGEKAFTVVPPSAFTYDPTHIKKTKAYVAPEPVQIGKPGDSVTLRDVHPAFTLETIRPKDFHPMVGGLDVTKDGTVYVSTWDSTGAVYKLENINNGNPESIKVTKIASGLAEPLGLKVVDGDVYIMQKQELTHLIDHDKDGITDEYETVSNAWKVSSNFHEFGFGLVYKDGYFYATLATAIMPGGASAKPQIPDRGKVVKISRKDGTLEFIAKGLRTPNGIGFGVDGEMFVADNQGDWLPSSKILHVIQGAFYGSRSVDPDGTANTPVTLPVVWLPQDEIGNSPSQPLALEAGPYKGQMMHGEVTHGGLKRVFAEKVDGAYQGCVFDFIQGLEAGVNRAVLGPDGKYYVGGIGNPGNWGQTDKLWYGLQRLTYNGTSVFEMLAVRAKSNGMEIEFTEPLAGNDGFNPAEYLVKQWWYKPTIDYGGPKMDEEVLKVSKVTMSEDRKKVFLEIPNLKKEHVVYIHLEKPWVSAQGHSLWTTQAWYTLNKIPANAPGFTSSLVGEVVGLNALSQAEQAAGWKLLFDGKTTQGWHTFAKPTVGKAWKVQDGALSLSTGENVDWKTRDGGDIITNDQYENYELNLEWKISPNGNSGIMFNVVEDPKYKDTYETGPEMQVLDILGHPDGRIPKHRAGDLYDLIASPYYPTRPVGEWNYVRIIINHGKLEQWLNGVKVVSTEMWTPEWNALVAGSKFVKMPDFGKAHKGHIALQDHGNPVWYRNIKIKELK